MRAATAHNLLGHPDRDGRHEDTQVDEVLGAVPERGILNICYPLIPGHLLSLPSVLNP
jgi:hypothetical protein